jgi:4-aminobutyrate aminotransferase
VASAKGLGAGVPIGAMIGRAELTRRWKPGAHGNTYGGNALACAAASAVMQLVDEELMENAAAVGAYLLERLQAMQERYEQIGAVRGRGLMIGVEFVTDRVSREPARALAQNLMEAAFQRGLLLLTCGASTIRICPPLVLTREEADEGLLVFEEALRAVLA